MICFSSYVYLWTDITIIRGDTGAAISFFSRRLLRCLFALLRVPARNDVAPQKGCFISAYRRWSGITVGIVFVGYYRQAPEWGLTIECHGCTVGEDSDEGRDSSLRVETGNAGLNY